MSEETETTTPDTKSFDISKWLATGEAGPTRTNKTVTVYQRPELLERAHMLKRQADRHNQKVEQTGGEDLSMAEQSEAGKIQAELDHLEAEIRESKAEIQILAMSDEDVEEIARVFKQRYPGEKSQWDSTIKGTCLALAHKTDIDGTPTPIATFDGHHLSADTWRKLSNGVLAGGQWQKIKTALVAATRAEPRVDNPF